MTDSEDVVSTFERIGGAPAISLLVDRFYDRMETLPAAGAIRAMHGKDLGSIRQTLKLYLAEWMGGPKSYSAKKGHPRLRQRHIGFSIGREERDAWLLCMIGALEETIADPALREEIRGAMAKLADWMRNQPGNPHDARR